MADSHPGSANPQAELESDQEESVSNATVETEGTAPAKKRKKKTKRSKVAASLGLSNASAAAEASRAPASPSDGALQQLLEMNPALKGEFSNLPPEKVKEMLGKLDLSQLLQGVALNGRGNQKDMASYKFWATQPVPRLDETREQRMQMQDGPIKEVDPEKVPKEPGPLPGNYEWVELDLTDDNELKEIYELLNGHYVEDDKATFRFAYSKSFLDWALKAPGWRRSWHVGVRASTEKRTLVATIFGIPTELRVRDKLINVVEINFLCVHKQLRSKRLAPVMIREVTRRCNLEGIYQAIYTAGVVLPTPVSTCRYFHRPMQWAKLYDVGFCQLPQYMTKKKMIEKTSVVDKILTPGWREMQEKDIQNVHSLLTKYLEQFQLAQKFSLDEISHWFVNRREDPADRVVWAYVVEDPSNGAITDFASFYNLESSVIGEASSLHSKIRAAYMFYYASTAALAGDRKKSKPRLINLIGDLIVEAKRARFDVFNALTLLDNPLLLKELGFSPGDGQLHYYLYNWRTAPVSGGTDKSNMPDEQARGGMGMIML